MSGLDRGRAPRIPTPGHRSAASPRPGHRSAHPHARTPFLRHPATPCALLRRQDASRRTPVRSGCPPPYRGTWAGSRAQRHRGAPSGPAGGRRPSGPAADAGVALRDGGGGEGRAARSAAAGHRRVRPLRAFRTPRHPGPGASRELHHDAPPCGRRAVSPSRRERVDDRQATAVLVGVGVLAWTSGSAAPSVITRLQPQEVRPQVQAQRQPPMAVLGGIGRQLVDDEDGRVPVSAPRSSGGAALRRCAAHCAPTPAGRA